MLGYNNAFRDSNRFNIYEDIYFLPYIWIIDGVAKRLLSPPKMAHSGLCYVIASIWIYEYVLVYSSIRLNINSNGFED